MNHWLESLKDTLQSGEDCVLVSVATVRGSAPREPGAKMIVTLKQTEGTIGGGRLEYECTRIAASALEDPGPPIFTRRFPLGANLGQCCGGVVEVVFERLEAASVRWPAVLLKFYRERTAVAMATGAAGIKHLVTDDACRNFGDVAECGTEIEALARAVLTGDLPAVTQQQTSTRGAVLLEAVTGTAFNIAVFGAGHVGSACVATLSQLDCDIRWIDSRRDAFPVRVPDNVRCVETSDPAREVLAIPAVAFYLVMTHSHPLDYEICQRILERRDFAYCGLIGSRSKRRKFEQRMRAQGRPELMYRRLTCPIGVPGIAGKKPAEIAVAVAAELLRLRDRADVQASGPARLHVLEQQ